MTLTDLVEQVDPGHLAPVRREALLLAADRFLPQGRKTEGELVREEARCIVAWMQASLLCVGEVI